MATMPKVISTFKGAEVTETMLRDAAEFFGDNYGIWGTGGFGKPGSRVKMSAARLRSECLPEGSRSFYFKLTMDESLVGNAFTCRWEHAGRQDEIFGIMSSHPAACKSLAKAVGDFSFSDVALDFARDHAAGIKAASPVR